MKIVVDEHVQVTAFRVEGDGDYRIMIEYSKESLRAVAFDREYGAEVQLKDLEAGD